MDSIERVFEGADLIIPSRAIEDMGFKPGDRVVIRPKTKLRRGSFGRAETERRLQALDDLYGSWTVEEEREFDRTRRELWSSWRTRS